MLSERNTSGKQCMTPNNESIEFLRTFYQKIIVYGEGFEIVKSIGRQNRQFQTVFINTARKRIRFVKYFIKRKRKKMLYDVGETSLT